MVKKEIFYLQNTIHGHGKVPTFAKVIKTDIFQK